MPPLTDYGPVSCDEAARYLGAALLRLPADARGDRREYCLADDAESFRGERPPDPTDGEPFFIDILYLLPGMDPATTGLREALKQGATHVGVTLNPRDVDLHLPEPGEQRRERVAVDIAGEPGVVSRPHEKYTAARWNHTLPDGRVVSAHLFHPGSPDETHALARSVEESSTR